MSIRPTDQYATMQTQAKKSIKQLSPSEIKQYVDTYYTPADAINKIDYNKIMLDNTPGAKYARLLQRLDNAHSWTEGWGGTAAATVAPFLGGFLGTLLEPGGGTAAGYGIGTAAATGIDVNNARLAKERADLYRQLGMHDAADSENLWGNVNYGLAGLNLLPGSKFYAAPAKQAMKRGIQYAGKKAIINKNTAKQLVAKSGKADATTLGRYSSQTKHSKKLLDDLKNSWKTEKIDWGYINRRNGWYEPTKHMAKSELGGKWLARSWNKTGRAGTTLLSNASQGAHENTAKLNSIAAQNLQSNYSGWFTLSPDAQSKLINDYAQRLRNNPNYKYNKNDFSPQQQQNSTGTNNPSKQNKSQNNQKSDSIAINGKNYAFS